MRLPIRSSFSGVDLTFFKHISLESNRKNIDEDFDKDENRDDGSHDKNYFFCIQSICRCAAASAE